MKDTLTTIRKERRPKMAMKLLGAACFILHSSLFISSCSDFDDYNEAPADNVAAGNQTLWQNIRQNSQLTNFAALLQRTGYDKELDKTRTYTVWAPLDNTYDATALQALDDSTLAQQFIKGHIAEYSHVASGQTDERIHMLNSKSFDFEGNGTYDLGGVAVSKANQPSSNGVMHLLDGAAPFYYNLYEYIMSNPNDSLLRQFFAKYELTTLDTKNSVKGPVVNGLQTYIDSVFVTSNSLLRTVNASLTNEDSTYTFLLPNDKAYQEMYDRVKPYYNFINTTVVQDVDKFTSASSSTTKTITVNASQLTDSLVRRTIVRNLAYSNKDEYNQWLVGTGEFSDTLRSTNRNKFSNPQEILGRTVDRITMSNGYAHVIDSIAFLPWETYLPELQYSLFAANNTDSRSRFNYTSTAVSVDDPEGLVFGPDVTNFYYLDIIPTGDYVKPEIFLDLSGVMSTTYHFYCVFLPAKLYSETGDSLVLNTDERPNILNFQLNYCTAAGKTATYSFSSKYLGSGKSSDENPRTLNLTTAFTNDPLKTDTVYLGKFTFPVAHNGLGGYNPNLHISCPVSVFNRTQMATYTREVRIAAILMKPAELVEYEEKQK